MAFQKFDSVLSKLLIPCFCKEKDVGSHAIKAVLPDDVNCYAVVLTDKHPG